MHCMHISWGLELESDIQGIKLWQSVSYLLLLHGLLPLCTLRTASSDWLIVQFFMCINEIPWFYPTLKWKRPVVLQFLLYYLFYVCFAQNFVNLSFPLHACSHNLLCMYRDWPKLLCCFKAVAIVLSTCICLSGWCYALLYTVLWNPLPHVCTMSLCPLHGNKNVWKDPYLLLIFLFHLRLGRMGWIENYVSEVDLGWS